MSASTNPTVDLEGTDGRGKSTRICRHFARGRCTWGDQCRFSHDPSTQQQQQQMSQSPMSAHTDSQQQQQQRPQTLANISVGASPTVGGGPVVMPVANSAWIGQQQSQLQQQRHSILMAALSGQFVLQLDGASGVVKLPNLNAADVPVTIYRDGGLRNELAVLERDEKIRDGGLHYLVGEPSVFWSMMRLLHTEGTTGSPQWDMLVQRALSGKVGCMFYHSAAGCLAPRCVFEHIPRQHSQLMALATSNAMLSQVPALFGGVTAQQQVVKDPAFVSIAAGGGGMNLGGGGMLGHLNEGSSSHILTSGVGSQQVSQGNWACVSGQAVLGSSSHLGSLLVGRNHDMDSSAAMWTPAGENLLAPPTSSVWQ